MFKDFVNLGCGTRFHCNWTNVDFKPASPAIICHDLTRQLPFRDGQFSVVYHSHLLEHLTRSQATKFMCECWRILKKGGILRVVVPDLELLAKSYLHHLDRCKEKGLESDDHSWAVVQLIDQCSRDWAGGEMLPFLYQASSSTLSRLAETSSTANQVKKNREMLQQASGVGVGAIVSKSNNYFHRRVSGIFQRFAGKTKSRKIGSFRLSGETHKWMYDSISLSHLLTHSGFTVIGVHDFKTSKIPGWLSFGLDSNEDGSAYKPDSLYVEAIKNT